MSETPFASIADKQDLEAGTTLAPRFDANGLITAVIQHAGTGEILMLAHMNAEALARSIETGLAHFWSRSRQSLWLKGETSGETFRIVQMLTDCDQDAVVMRCDPQGVKKAACHTGRTSCFYRDVGPLSGPASGVSLKLTEDAAR